MTDTARSADAVEQASVRAWVDYANAQGIAPLGEFARDDFMAGFHAAWRAQQPSGQEAVEHREGIVEVYDHQGHYLGCLGERTWAKLLDAERAAEGNNVPSNG